MVAQLEREAYVDMDNEDDDSLAPGEGASPLSPRRTNAAKVVVLKTEEEMSRIASMVQSNFMFQVLIHAISIHTLSIHPHKTHLINTTYQHITPINLSYQHT